MSRVRNRARNRKDESAGLIVLPAAVFLAREMLRCLMAMHSMGYIHRDVKPANFVRRSRDTTGGYELAANHCLLSAVYCVLSLFCTVYYVLCALCSVHCLLSAVSSALCRLLSAVCYAVCRLCVLFYILSSVCCLLLTHSLSSSHTAPILPTPRILSHSSTLYRILYDRFRPRKGFPRKRRNAESQTRKRGFSRNDDLRLAVRSRRRRPVSAGRLVQFGLCVL